MNEEYLKAIEFIKNGFCEAGLYNLIKQSNLNHPESLYLLGELYHNGLCVERDLDKAIFYYEKASLFKYRNSFVNLGILYQLKGNLEKAFFYFNKGSELDCPVSQFNVGLFYDLGIFVSKDYSLAFKFYSLSAEKNYSDSLLNLGNLYAEGLGVKQDIFKAIELWQIASKQGSILAKNNLSKIE